jgi:RNA polymerase sigma-70 factor (ECF subfamily)
MTTSTDDAELARHFKGGDLAAFEELLRRYQHKIYNLCRYMLQDAHHAQDAAQEAFLKAYSGFEQFRAESSLYSWLYRIAVNTCLDYKKKVRSEQIRDEAFLDDLPSSEPSPERLYQSKEIGYALQAALQKLPEHLRAAIILREMEDLPYEEIGEVLHISLGTVKSRISRAREELRQLLQKKDIGP